MRDKKKTRLTFARSPLGNMCLAAFLIVAGSVTVACNELRPRAASRIAETPQVDAAEGSGFRSPSAAHSEGDARHSFARWPVENGCARTWSASSDAGPAADLMLLSSMCAPGLAPLRSAPFELNVSRRERAVVPLSFESSSVCLRALAVSSVDGIELSILQGEDSVAGAYGAGKIVVVPPDGPVCLSSPQGLRLVLRNPGDQASGPALARVATNVWFAQGE